MFKVLTIAGSDSSGGAGIQADLKTFLATGVYGMSAITAITAQNTQGVTASEILSADLLRAQIAAVFDDIRPDAVKIGMIGNTESIHTVAESLQHYQAKNIVLDPVMVATSGSALFNPEELAALTQTLFPLADLLTPNISEAETILDCKITNEEDMEVAGQAIFDQYGCPCLIKGGHIAGQADDVLVWSEGIHWFRGQRIANPNTHGTGCSLSSAIASYLAQGNDLLTSIQAGKDYLTAIISAQLDLGQGSGPLDHGYLLRKEDNHEA